MEYKVILYNASSRIDITSYVLTPIKLTSTRQNTPSILIFKIARNALIQNNATIDMQNGNMIDFIVNDNGIFKGFIFEKYRDKNQIITIKCYDQIRYLKANQNYVMVNKKASDVVNIIANDFGLQTGEIDDTSYTLPPLNLTGQSLLQTIQHVIRLTLINSNKLFIFYDNFGKLTLSSIDNMVTDFVLSDDTNIVDFKYNENIENTYNKVVLSRDDVDKGKREIFIAQDSNNISKWGLLQHFETISENYNHAQLIELANNILIQKNNENKVLSVTVMNVDANLEKLKAGNVVLVQIKGISDKDIFERYLIETCSHEFNHNEHSIQIKFY